MSLGRKAKKSQEWINKKTQYLIEEEGYSSDQAYAMANSMAKESNSKRQFKKANGKCPDSGCVEQDASGDWRVISNKTGKYWPQTYDTKKDAQDALKAYHAKGASNLKKTIVTAASAVSRALKVYAKEDGKPDKVVEIADAVRRENPDMSDEQSYRISWETYCSYVNPSYEGCTEKGKSKRKSPKSEY